MKNEPKTVLYIHLVIFYFLLSRMCFSTPAWVRYLKCPGEHCWKVLSFMRICCTLKLELCDLRQFRTRWQYPLAIWSCHICVFLFKKGLMALNLNTISKGASTSAIGVGQPRHFLTPNPLKKVT